MPELNPTSFEELERNPCTGDYVLVEFSPVNNKRKTIFYIGKILSTNTDESEFELSFFLRKSTKVDVKSHFPQIQDIATVAKRDIKMILPNPVNDGTTKRQNSYFSFEIKFNLNIQ